MRIFRKAFISPYFGHVCTYFLLRNVKDQFSVNCQVFFFFCNFLNFFFTCLKLIKKGPPEFIQYILYAKNHLCSKSYQTSYFKSCTHMKKSLIHPNLKYDWSSRMLRHLKLIATLQKPKTNHDLFRKFTSVMDIDQ